MAGNLVLDFGNTSLKAAIFDNEGLAVQEFLLQPDPEEVLQFVRGREILACILAAVVDYPHHLETDLQAKFPLIKLDEFTAMPVKNRYESPATLGYDRIAAACGAWQLFPNTNVLAIVAGTCITYNIVNKKGEFLGGAIAPGLNMRLRAMHTFTGKLPLAKLEGNNPLTGTTTETSLRSGTYHAACAEIEGMIARYSKAFPGLEPVIGGGDGVFLAEGVKNGIFARPNLVTEGLNSILEYHAANNLL
ncbi:MAG TPA: type III pantothenate kinase [Bacteroidia bacterium]|nr:type III pantothenate kinase [Bacteroidia bacterium]